ncbi:MAG: hypothetical protein ACXVCY_01720 [Pseudobdellovibrionaceae bacterium]
MSLFSGSAKKYSLLLTIALAMVSANKTFAGSGESCAGIFNISFDQGITLNATSKTSNKGFFQSLKSVFSKPYEATAEKKNKQTVVKLSGEQPDQKNSIKDNLKQVQNVINNANSALLTEFSLPKEVYVSLDEKKVVNDASITAYKMDLGKKELGYSKLGFLKKFLQGSAFNEAIPVIVHEYFHLILNQTIGDYSPYFKSEMDKYLLKDQDERISHKTDDLQKRIKSLDRQALFTQYLVTLLKDLKINGKGSVKRNQTVLKNYLKDIDRDDLFSGIEFSDDNLDEMIELFESFESNALVQIEKYKKLKTAHDNPESTDQVEPSANEQKQMAHIQSFYSKSIHELFADLGAVLLSENPSIVAHQLDSIYRDFNHNWTIDEASAEYEKSMTALKKRVESKFLGKEPSDENENQMENLYAVHSFFFYLRGVLWHQYFAKAPKSAWPKMLKALADAFAKEMVNNPTDIYTPAGANTYMVDFKLANQHLENIIKEALKEP